MSVRGRSVLPVIFDFADGGAMRFLLAAMLLWGCATGATADVGFLWATCQTEQKVGVPVNIREIYPNVGSTSHIEKVVPAGRPGCDRHKGVALKCYASQSPGWYAWLMSSTPKKFIGKDGYPAGANEPGTAYVLCGAATYEHAVSTLLELCAGDGQCSSQQSLYVAVNFDAAGLVPGEMEGFYCGYQSYTESVRACEGTVRGVFKDDLSKPKLMRLKEAAASAYAKKTPPKELHYVTIGALAPHPAILGPSTRPNANLAVRASEPAQRGQHQISGPRAGTRDAVNAVSPPVPPTPVRPQRDLSSVTPAPPSKWID
jgi:hypothetical protein